MDRIKIGTRIRHLRILYNLTQQELGSRIGVGPTTIANYEKGYSSPNLTRLTKLANALGTEYQYFIDDKYKCRSKEKLAQKGTHLNLIPYYKDKNTNGILLGDLQLADCFITLPSDISINTQSLICTNVTDNSMANAGIKKSSYVIADCNKGPINGETALVFCTSANKFIVRKFITDGPMIMLVSDGYGDDTATIYTNRNDGEYKIRGTVVRAIINV